MAGATLGLAAVDFFDVVPGPAVVGDQVQIDGQGLAAAPQAAGQVALQSAVETALQLGQGGEGGGQGLVDGGVGRGAEEGGTGGRPRAKFTLTSASSPSLAFLASTFSFFLISWYFRKLVGKNALGQGIFLEWDFQDIGKYLKTLAGWIDVAWSI